MGYTVQTLDPQTWLIEEENEDCNVYMYLLAGKDQAVLIDAGYGTIPLDKIVSSLTGLPVTVLCTHGHFDHIGGVGFFSRIMLHRSDRPLYREALCENAPEPEWFDGAFTMDLGDRPLEVFPVPGHTAGCVAILDAQRRQLFTGDTCCKGAVLLHFDHSADLSVYRDSLRTLLELRDRFDATWPSHHEKPVDVCIPLQFLEAADRILAGHPAGQEIPGPAGILDYRDITVFYKLPPA